MQKDKKTKLAPEYLFRVMEMGQAIICALLMLACIPACAAQRNSAGATAGVEDKKANDQLASASRESAEALATLSPEWRPLMTRLAGDGLAGPETLALLKRLPSEPTQSPMGKKIRELYRRQFMPRPASKPVQQYYKNVVNEANAELCKNFIAAHEGAFALARDKYGVPPAIASALLFVETRLGKVLADVPENAFYTLASMAVSTKPQDISQYLPSLPGYQKHMPWLEDTLRKRADWAYNETRALVRHMLRDHVSPDNLPSSIYGAVGLCQFMPSNISVYGADGNGDGRVDLFNVPDAVASLANYLARHGWKPDLSYEGKHKVLMSYNHSRVYANTILALADLVEGRPPTPPPSRTRRSKGKAR